LDLEKFQSRVPARRIVDIPSDVVDSLSHGVIETKNLTEWLAVDRQQLLTNVANELGLAKIVAVCGIWTDDLIGQSSLKHSFAVGRFLAEHVAVGDPIWKSMSIHGSDVVREWAAIMIGVDAKLAFAKKLAWMKPLADDGNAGLREVSWLALRPDVTSDLEGSIRSLTAWTGSRRERLRRYACEITRPCGVWTPHIGRLKEEPALALSILNPLKADDSKYVKDSVGNWLNDASKSQPDWVRSLVQSWVACNDSKHTAYIAKRALRTIGGKP
jgi:3-methyladenine DNA glycosylase AlkC